MASNETPLDKIWAAWDKITKAEKRGKPEEVEAAYAELTYLENELEDWGVCGGCGESHPSSRVCKYGCDD